MNIVDRKTFEGYDTDSKLNTLFDYAKDIREEVKTVKVWKTIQTGVTALTGFMGGMSAVWMWVKFLK